MIRLYEELKFDTGVKPQVLNNTSVTGSYFHMTEYRKAVAVMLVNTLADTKYAKLEILEADDSSGTNAAAVSGASATITASGAMSEGKAYVELDCMDLSKPYIAAKITTDDATGSFLCAATLLRGRPRGAVTQDADASTAL